MVRQPHPSVTRADADARLARVDALFDAVMAQADDLLADLRQAGPRSPPRDTDGGLIHAGTAPQPPVVRP